MSKMAAVRALLSANPKATPSEIVAALAKQKMIISEGVASNYKSVIRNKRKRRKKRAMAAALEAPVVMAQPEPEISGLDPAMLELLKAGKHLGWKQVRSIAEMMES